MSLNPLSENAKKIARFVTKSHAAYYALAAMAIVLALLFACGSKFNDGATSLAALADCINQPKTLSNITLLRCSQENMATHIVRVQSAYSVGRNVISVSAFIAVVLALLVLWVGRTHVLFRVAVLAGIAVVLFYQLGTTV